MLQLSQEDRLGQDQMYLHRIQLFMPTAEGPDEASNFR